MEDETTVVHGVTVYVSSEITIDGEYGLTISIPEKDKVWPLSREQAVKHALACFQIGVLSETAAALYAETEQVTGEDASTVSWLVFDAMLNGFIYPDADTFPFTLRVAQSKSHGSIVLIESDGVGKAGVWPTATLFEHAMSVLQVLFSVQLDQQIHDWLMRKIDVDAGRAHAVVHSLADRIPEYRLVGRMPDPDESD